MKDRLLGRIVRWDEERRFGFVRSPDSVEDVFVHISEFPSARRRPRIGDRLTFNVAHDEQQRQRAVNVTLRRTLWLQLLTIALLIAAIVIAVVQWMSLGPKMQYWVAAFLGAMLILSGITFWSFARDKQLAQQQRWRVSEFKLLLLSLLGGWPGGLLAQRVYHHKNRKFSFQFRFWLAVVAHVGLTIAAHRYFRLK